MAPNDLTPCRMAFYFVSTFAIAQTPTKQPALRLSRTKNLHFAKAPFPGFSAGDAVPALAVPAIDGFSGSCADDSQVEINFTARTNGGVRFEIYVDATSGEQIDTPSMAIDYWHIPNCSWSGESTQPEGYTGGNQVYSNEYMSDQVYIACQASVAEQTGSQSFCLTPGIPYRVRFDGVQPFLPGPMELGFKLAGMDTSAPIPANWISTCALDGTTENCDLMSATLSGPPAHAGRPDAPWRPAHAGRPGNPGGGGRPGLDAPLLTAEDGTAGAASCTAAGSKVSCTWTANGTWELPSLYTDPGGWITIQAVGGSGGFGIPASNSGVPRDVRRWSCRPSPWPAKLCMPMSERTGSIRQTARLPLVAERRRW
ncbi:MAG: hypothetical protein A6F70_09915 [Cycloclasticus sp. symbiont of Bathymodiolus heckerae]|nr:MAG: hypothetical protein A6F70_09915 [Cycloclasticus sp. symbiont of Bathymodiolus heckerae]